ncbi:24762_t:CDS:2 [Dentiscutata erythropus]|uniref:24762_t:CDS:1 n=1 Tax=Dentiscutata erythropus TaxID=1348616 RepID=A0A9N8V8Z5_9GLOM|nr:24762_t:CDS:2 [Dentiscutata erythropus]
MNKIPVECFCEILEHLDNEALRSCTCVNSQWFGRALGVNSQTAKVYEITRSKAKRHRRNENLSI